MHGAAQPLKNKVPVRASCRFSSITIVLVTAVWLFIWSRSYRLEDVAIIDEKDIAARAKGSFYLTQTAVSAVNCKKLFAGNQREISKAEQYMRSKPKEKFNIIKFADGLNHCDRFRKIRGYPSRPLSREEEGFPLAFR